MSYPICILKQKTSFIGMTNTTFYLLRNPDESMAKELSRTEAKEYIEKHGLVPQLTMDGGELYDTPEKSFQEKYRGYFAKRQNTHRHYGKHSNKNN